MNVIFRYPQTEEGLNNLSSAVAKVHTQYVIFYLNKKPFEKADKDRIINEIIQENAKSNTSGVTQCGIKKPPM